MGWERLRGYTAALCADIIPLKPMILNPTPLEILILFVVSLSIYAWMRHGSAIRRWWAELWKKRRGRRQLKPKSPEVCPKCTIWSHILPGHGQQHARPWSEVRGKSGRRKRVDTRGYACQNPVCEYYRVTDPAIHALVSAGRRGVRKDILFLRCQACGQRQTSRTDTPVKGLKTPLERVRLVVMALAEGLDLSAAGRIFGHHPTTMARWVERCGAHGARLHEQVLFRVIEAGHVQLDELVTRVKNKADRVFVWTAIEAHSKLVLGLHIGDGPWLMPVRWCIR